MSKSYKYLFFDADNTLLDFNKTEEQALVNTFQQFGIPLTENLKKRYLEINSILWQQYEDGYMSREEVIYKRFVNLFEEFNIHEDGIYFEDVYQENLGRGYHLVENALEVVRTLSDQFNLYIVTNGIAKTQYRRLIDSGLYPYFKEVFVSEKIGYRKPMKEYFNYCFEHIKDIVLNDVLIVGDSLSSDIQGGVNSNIDTCWFNPNHKINNKNIDITYEIDSLCKLYDILCVSSDK